MKVIAGSLRRKNDLRSSDTFRTMWGDWRSCWGETWKFGGRSSELRERDETEKIEDVMIFGGEVRLVPGRLRCMVRGIVVGIV